MQCQSNFRAVDSRSDSSESKGQLPVQFQGNFRAISVIFRRRIGAIPGQFWVNSRAISAQFGDKFGAISGQFRGIFGTIPGQFQCNSSWTASL